jgi:hypothetical protein
VSDNQDLQFNLPQLLHVLAPQKHKMNVWGRGAGKSTILGYTAKEVAFQMPRASVAIACETYVQALTRTLPSTINGLAMMGYHKDIHFTVGKRGPKNWPEPFEPPLDYKHSIHFITGTVFDLVSQDRAGYGRGRNVDFVMGDEAALLNEEQLGTDVLATNRGNIKRYPKCKFHHGTVFTTTHALTPRGRWVYKYRELAMKKPLEYFYLAASARENVANLDEGYFQMMKEMLTEWLYNVEVENQEITQITDGFYPLLNEDKHTYTNFNYKIYDSLGSEISTKTVNCDGDADLDPSLPLLISVDWGAAINVMVVAQMQGNTLRFLKSFFVKSPKILDHLFEEEFMPYYLKHKITNSDIFFWYDRNGNSRFGNSDRTFFEQARDILHNQGWNIKGMTRGADPPHDRKFNLWNKLLSERYDRIPKIRINRHNCRELLISMCKAKAKDQNGIHKDKSSERSKTILREHATDFSDAADILVFGLFNNYLDAAPTHIDVMMLGDA